MVTIGELLRTRRRLVAACAVAVVLAALHWLGKQLSLADSFAMAVVDVPLVVVVVGLGFLAVRFVWRWLTYRVGVRLFLSYLLVGLVPFGLFAVLSAIAGYLLVGQYGAARAEQLVGQYREALTSRAQSALSSVAAGNPTGAIALLREFAAPGRPPVLWIVDDGQRQWRSEGATDVPAPAWLGEGGWNGVVVRGDTAYLGGAWRQGGRLVVLLTPVDKGSAVAFTRGRWFEMRWGLLRPGPTSKNGDGRLAVTIDGRRGNDVVKVNNEKLPESYVESGWLTSRWPGESWARRLGILWLWTLNEPRQLDDGAKSANARVLVILRVHVVGAVGDFFGDSERVKKEVGTALLITGGAFAVIYLVAVGFAVVMIMSIARSASRLTRGTRAVGRGDLAYRIPVKRHDQLGDLALAFNGMTESVQHMLAEVAEKERMRQEMELAREIQRALLPQTDIEHGGLSVHACFRPAAEVGGDTFDVFRLAEGRLIVGVGDVAGHGLPTGLLMAMVKSAMAALVGEGYRRADLVERLNALLLQQNIKQRMATLVLAEIDRSGQSLEITSAGHPPGFLITPERAVEELLLSSLPLGSRLPAQPASWSGAFPPGSKLVLYSDGLLEAIGRDGGAFGYAGLREVLNRHALVRGEVLVQKILAAFDAHLGGLRQGDDLTILVVEHPGSAQ
jgi:serine phosphatase RsbU (regulator of sigma subunit)